MTKRFEMGRAVATAGVMEYLEEAGVDTQATLAVWIDRHLSGDWGEVDAEDAAANERAVAEGERVLSLYKLGAHRRVYVITEADRSVTTVLFPEEY